MKRVILLSLFLIAGLLIGIIGYFLHFQEKVMKIKDINKLLQAKKIAVIGCPGSGKTYLTFKLYEKLQLPIIHLDQYAWKPGWERVDF